MIPDSLFSPPQSPVFVLSESLFLPPQSPCFVLVRVPFTSCSESRFPPSSKPRSRPLHSSPSSFFLLLAKEKQRNDTKPSRRSRGGFVPKWNILLSFRVRPQSAAARLAHLKAVVPFSQLHPGLAANVLVHSNVKHAVIARPAADE